MDSNHSILWNDSTPDQDRLLVAYLVENIVAGQKVDGHYDNCINKIMDTIQTEAWQNNFPHRTHIFSIYYGISIKTIAEIKFSLHAQALELLYFNIASASSSLVCDTGISFDQKLRVVFQEIYKWRIPQDTADAIRILRNDVMHTGSIEGALGANRNTDDPARIDRFFAYYEFNKNQQNSNLQNRLHLAAGFNYLIQDTLIRTLGLDQDDLSFNGNPPWRWELFGYDHENRPAWLRK